MYPSGRKMYVGSENLSLTRTKNSDLVFTCLIYVPRYISCYAHVRCDRWYENEFVSGNYKDIRRSFNCYYAVNKLCHAYQVNGKWVRDPVFTPNAETIENCKYLPSYSKRYELKCDMDGRDISIL